MDIFQQFKDRRVSGVHIGILSNWYHVDVDTSNDAIMRRIYELTSGRLMIGIDSISFEDERDAIACKLLA